MAPEKFKRFKERLEKSVQAAIAEGVHIVRLSDKANTAELPAAMCRCPLGCLILHTKWRHPSAGLLSSNAVPPIEPTHAEIGAFIVGFENGDLQTVNDLAYSVQSGAVAYMRLGQEYCRKYVTPA